MVTKARVVFGAAAIADPAALWWATPRLADTAGGVRHPVGWLNTVGTDRVVSDLVASAGWLVGVWIAVALLCAGTAALPGLAGRIGTALARAVVPRVVYRVVAGSAGLGVLLTPVVCATAATTPGPNPAVSASAAGSTSPSPVPAPRWPVGSSPATSTPAEHSPVPPTSTHHSTPSTQATPSTRARPPTHTRPSGGSSGTTGPDHHPSEHPHRSPGGDPAGVGPGAGSAPPTVEVRPSDSLWLLAAHRLGPRATPAEVARYWPELYGANRAAIGSDPDLIRPGQILREPVPSADVRTGEHR